MEIRIGFRQFWTTLLNFCRPPIASKDISKPRKLILISKEHTWSSPRFQMSSFPVKVAPVAKVLNDFRMRLQRVFASAIEHHPSTLRASIEHRASIERISSNNRDSQITVRTIHIVRPRLLLNYYYRASFAYSVCNVLIKLFNTITNY